MAIAKIEGAFGVLACVDLPAQAGAALQRLPVTHRILLENLLRQGGEAARQGKADLLAWLAHGRSEAAITFSPSRILMHDTTCGPALVDIAAMRDVLAAAGGDPSRLNPDRPVATSTDHSLAVDFAGGRDAAARNMARELERNGERYRFMKWASGAVDGFRVFPPGSGIMHTINMERLATVVGRETRDGVAWAVPDTLVGTDSHTPMINALGVLGWGVGGLEAEGAMFRVPVTLRIPEVVGVRLTGALGAGATATDLALVVTERLRRLGVAGEFVEFFGPGVGALSVGQRSVAANMAPEYGASTGFFPIDGRTLDYLRITGRDEPQIALVEAYARRLGLWRTPDQAPRYTETIEIDLSVLTPSVAGPRRPQDRLDLAAVPAALAPALAGVVAGGPGAPPADAVAIAAIASCTNTTDLALLVAAGLVARKARALGLAPPAWVRTSLTPGSPATSRRLERAGLLEDLEALGFSIAGYGCATCIGNSGPLPAVIEQAVIERGLKPIAVLSGNRNFPGRVHAQVDHALLASPALVVAYALAGRAALDIASDPIGQGPDGKPVRLADLWPAADEVEAIVRLAADPGDVAQAYDAAEASPAWAALSAPETARFPWDLSSTYLRAPPFVRLDPAGSAMGPLRARVLLALGDDVTTDHISPAGAIPPDSEAGRWLVAHGADAADLNVYASRRGNWEVMVRGLFTNRTLRNHLGEALPPGWTYDPDGLAAPAWTAAQRFMALGAPLVIIAGERYGTGSSRDWAAKGVQLLGVRAVLASSFERIHRSNLVGMGVAPLRLPDGWRTETLGLTAADQIEIDWALETLAPRAPVAVRVLRENGSVLEGQATALVETQAEIALLRAGGMIPSILRRALERSEA
ncbi:aconitate hydratase AcnA [Caulobacter segnis]